jgi:phosphonate transport system substrate-binding protein
MTSHFPMIILVVAIIMSSLVSFGHAAETPKPIQLAILPCENIETTFKKFYPLLRYLIQQTGLEVNLMVPTDFSTFETSLRKGEIDFAFQDPHTYLMTINFYNNDALLRALSQEGKTSHSAAVVVRQDSQIKTLSDLKARTVMFGDKSSITKWVAARLLFAENGINIDKDLKAYSHGGSCEDIAFSVYLKSVDAGVTCDHFLGEHEEKQKELGVEAVKLMVISRTKLVPTRVFVPRKEVTQDIVAKINKALLKLDRKNPEHAKILFEAELGGFERAQPQDYSVVRKLMTKSLED